MKTTLRIGPGGRIGCLYTELIDLRSLGRLRVVRATDIRFNEATQEWEVRHAGPDADPAVLLSHASRGACLAWEQEHLQPQPTST